MENKKLYELSFMIWKPREWSKSNEREIMHEYALYYGSNPQAKGESLKKTWEDMGYEVFGFHYLVAVVHTD